MMFRTSKRRDTTPFIFVVSSVQRVQEASLRSVFSDGHPIMAFSRFYDDANLSRVDWDIMRQRYWKDTEEDNDRERRRQAEFLVHEALPWEAVDLLAVKSRDMQQRLDKLLAEEWPNRVKPVKVAPSWYFS